MAEESRFSVKVWVGMRKPSKSLRLRGRSQGLGLARVLVVHGELTPRLALQTILRAGGYAVDVAATPAEALAMLDEGAYELVLSDAQFGTGEVGPDLLAYARVKDYRPATALITSYKPYLRRRSSRPSQNVSVYTENLPHLLGKVAELIGIRASRRYRPLRQAV
jgi:CheY-like chemotaxis protein